MNSPLTRPRFGNYIGDAESDEEQHEDVQPQAFKFDEAFDDEEEEVNDQQLMEVDGMICTSSF